MKKLEKFKIVPQTKFVKFKVKHFVEIPTIRHDKAVPPLLDCLNSSFPLNVSPPWLLKLSSCPPAWLMTQKSFPPTPDPEGGGGEDTMISVKFILIIQGDIFFKSVIFRILQIYFCKIRKDPLKMRKFRNITDSKKNFSLNFYIYIYIYIYIYNVYIYTYIYIYI